MVLATCPGDEYPSSKCDLGEPCELELGGHAALPHISQPFMREEKWPEYDQFWEGAEERWRMTMCWLGAMLCAMPDAEIGMIVECPVCTTAITLVENLHAIDIDPQQMSLPPHEVPEELMNRMVRADCTACGMMCSGLHPRAALGYSGIEFRDE